MFRRGLNRVSLTARAAGIMRGGGGDHHGQRMLPFARMAPPTGKIPDETYYIWDDGVAPESAIDIEVPHVPLSQVIISQLVAALFILGVYGFACLVDPENRVEAAPRRLALPSRHEMEFDDNHGRG